MTYFHPWTLRQQDVEEDHVPFAGCLRTSPTWETSLAMCLEDNVISQESVRCISKLLSISRARPRDPNDEARSDEDFSGEEPILTEADLEEALKTRVGGRATDKHIL